MSNPFKGILEDILEEENFGYTKEFIKDTEKMLKNVKKGRYRLTEITEIKKKMDEIKSLLHVKK